MRQDYRSTKRYTHDDSTKVINAYYLEKATGRNRADIRTQDGSSWENGGYSKGYGMGRIGGILGEEIPYYSMIKKAMPGPEKKKKKFRNHRLTEVDTKTKKPRLKKGVDITRAVEVLYMFENTNVMPCQIEEMKQTIENLRQRVKKLEDWQE